MGRRRTNYDHLSYSEIAGQEMEGEVEQQGQQPQTANRKKKESEHVTGDRLHRMISKNDYRCMLSGVSISPEEATLDHSVPLSQGGEHEMSNLKIVHAIVNRMKGTMNEADFIGWYRKIAAWNG